MHIAHAVLELNTFTFLFWIFFGGFCHFLFMAAPMLLVTVVWVCSWVDDKSEKKCLHTQTDKHPHTHPHPHSHPHTHTHPILHATVSGSHLIYYLIRDVVHISLVIRGGLCKLYIVWYILVSSYISFLQLIFIVSIIVSIRAGPDAESKQNDVQEILYFMILYTI